MENYNFLNKKHIHFIGICGVSMSSLAMLTKSFNIEVSGSDQNFDVIVHKLRKNNIKVFIGHNANHITDDCDMVVFSGAIKEDNVEYQVAKEKNIPLVERSIFLGEMCKLFKNVIAIGGTHGKTTTTAMVCNIFEFAKLNPTMHLGGISNNFNSNIKVGGKDYFITEACEYRNSFKYIFSDACVVTSSDPDHLDSYKSSNDLKEAYQTFAKHSNFVVLTQNAKNINLKNNYIVVGNNENCGLCAKNLKCDSYGHYSFDAWLDKKYLANFKLNVVGEFNVYNALCAIAIALYYNISITTIYDALRDFSGVKRRNEKIGLIKDVPIICDYAHHPTEIEKTIIANKKIYKNILCVFQPHTYSRTKNFMPHFISAFKGVNKLILYKTYPAREEKIKGGDAKDLFKLVKIKSDKKFYAENKYQLKNLVYSNLENIDCILVLGAGNIYNIAKNVFK